MKLGLINIHTSACLKYGVVGANGIGFISSYLKKNLGLEDIFIEVDEKKILDHKPEIIGISSTTETYNKALAIAKHVKETLGIPVIIGGHHISALPHTLPTFIDAGVIGEGEQSMLELMNLAVNGRLNPDYLAEVTGIVFRNAEGNNIITPKRPVIDNLDDIPPPDRQLLKNIRGYNQSILTTRGCPFDCSFCSATSFWKKVRFHSPERIVSEIEDIIRHFPHQIMINIDDDLFTINTPRLKKLVNLIKETGLNKKVEFSVTARTSVFNETVCRLLAEMNVKRLFVGFEYGVDRILKYLKETVTARQNQRAIDLCEKYNMNVVGSFIVGVPIETREELAQNYWFIRKNFDTLTKVNMCFANAFPDTGFWDYAVSNNYLDDNFNEWWRMNLEYEPGKSIFMNKNYTEPEFAEYYRHFNEFQVNSTTRSIKDSPYTTRYVNLEYLKVLYTRITDFIPAKASALELSKQPQKINELLSETRPFEVMETISDIPEESRYDYISCIHYLENVKEPEKVLQKLRQHLNKDGYLILTVYNAAYIQVLSGLVYNDLKYSYAGAFQKKNLTMFTLPKLEKLVTENGFTTVQVIRNTNTSFDNKNIREQLALYLPETKNMLNESLVLSYIFVLKK